MTPRHLICFVFLAICLSAISRAETTPPTTLNIPAAARVTPNFGVGCHRCLARHHPTRQESALRLLLRRRLLAATLGLPLSPPSCSSFLKTRLSAHIRDWAARIVSNSNLRALLYVLPFFLITFLLQFPMGVYEGYLREHQYGLSTQTFGSWLRDQLVGLAVGLVLSAIAVMILFAIVRRLGKDWWVWGALTSVVLLVMLVLIAPVYIAPLFNTYVPLKDAKIKDSILSMARANGIPATDVYEVDESAPVEPRERERQWIRQNPAHLPQ